MHNLIQLFRYPNAVQESFSSLIERTKKKKKKVEGQDVLV